MGNLSVMPPLTELFKCHTVEVVELVSGDGLQDALKWLVARVTDLYKVQEAIDVPDLQRQIEDVQQEVVSLRSEAAESASKQVKTSAH